LNNEQQVYNSNTMRIIGLRILQLTRH